MKIGIVGTGAMGSVYAGLLGKAGHEVWAIDIWQEHLDAIANPGLTVSGASGTYVVDNLHVGRSPRDAGPCDVWVIATKAASSKRWRRRSPHCSSPTTWSWRSRTASAQVSGWPPIFPTSTS